MNKGLGMTGYDWIGNEIYQKFCQKIGHADKWYMDKREIFLEWEHRARYNWVGNEITRKFAKKKIGHADTWYMDKWEYVLENKHRTKYDWVGN